MKIALSRKRRSEQDLNSQNWGWTLDLPGYETQTITFWRRIQKMNCDSTNTENKSKRADAGRNTEYDEGKLTLEYSEQKLSVKRYHLGKAKTRQKISFLQPEESRKLDKLKRKLRTKGKKYYNRGAQPEKVRQVIVVLKDTKFKKVIPRTAAQSCSESRSCLVND